MLSANRVRSLLDAIHSNWDPFFPVNPVSVVSPSRPRIRQGEQGVLLEVDLPGVEADQIEVTAERNRISVGVKAAATTADTEPSYRIHERESREQAVTFELPFPVRESLVDVVYRNGVVRVTVTKPEEEHRRTLNVRQG